MKVLHILDSLNFSGVEMFLASSSRYMKKEKIKPSILSTGNKIGPAYNLLKKKGFKIKHISFAKHKIIGSLTRSLAFFSLLNFLMKNKFDIIQINTEANFFKFSLIAILSGHKKIIRTINNVFFPNLILRIRRRIILKFCKFFKIKFFSHSDIIIKNELKNYNLKVVLLKAWYDDYKFSFINYNTKQNLRKKLKISKNTLIIISIGNCSNIKNHDLIFKSLSILPKNLDWIYFHVGAEDDNKSERKLAKQLNIQKKCKFLGALSDHRNYTNISDVYIMSSTVEGLGIASIEAGAIGSIPILTKVHGNEEILRKVKGTIGINQTSESLKQAILKIYLMKRKQRSRLSFSIHKQMNKYWSSKNFYKWIKFYRNI